jgi:hypothetical protein
MLFAFLAWELPAMIVMFIHERVLRARNEYFYFHKWGTWTYRVVGMVTVWPTVAIVIALASAMSG